MSQMQRNAMGYADLRERVIKFLHEYDPPACDMLMTTVAEDLVLDDVHFLHESFDGLLIKNCVESKWLTLSVLNERYHNRIAGVSPSSEMRKFIEIIQPDEYIIDSQFVIQQMFWYWTYRNTSEPHWYENLLYNSASMEMELHGKKVDRDEVMVKYAMKMIKLSISNHLTENIPETEDELYSSLQSRQDHDIAADPDTHLEWDKQFGAKAGASAISLRFV